ncbi:hypothetical protein CRG98_020561 [Punica granatum]|uniref:Uncharacterized protein n=1 Tax=Punica granatum TaxID=22663 RepID=A0A2I0JRW6_PUNGR|nr:hypothetical protein CRG98_020561 [Punica granatum]
MWNCKIPSWCQSDQSHFREHFGGILLKPGHPRTLTDAFSNKAPEGPGPRTGKRHPGTGLHTSKDHQDHGTSFRPPFGVRLDLPSDSRPEKKAIFKRDLALGTHSVES